MNIRIFASTALLMALPALAQPMIDVKDGVPSIFNVSGAQPTLAPNVVFVIYGHNLGPASIVIAPPPDYPLSLAGTSVSFTPVAGGDAIAAFMYYSLENAVTGVLPSSTPPGDYLVSVTHDGQASAPQTVTVVARDFNIATANSAGSGVAQGTINGGLTLTRFTKTGMLGIFSFSATYPNDTVSLWGTGGGSDLKNDTGGSSGDQTTLGNFQVILAGRTITPSYTAAVAGYPGLWVMNFKVPGDIDPDCYAALQVSSNGVLSNSAVLPIAAPGDSTCFDPKLTPEILAKLDAGGSIVGGTFAVIHATSVSPAVVQEYGSGAFSRWTAAEWAAGGPGRPNLGACSVYDRTFPASQADPSQPDAFLDAGASLPLSGPGLSAGAALGRTVTAEGAGYSFLPAIGTFQAGSRYTLTSSGGTDIGPFTAGVNFPTSFTVTNLAAIAVVNRSTPLNVTWNAVGADYVTVVVDTTARIGANDHIVTIICYARASDGSVTIPVSAVSSLLPSPVTASAISVQGYSIETFTPNLTAGGQVDYAGFVGGFSVSQDITVQ